MQISNEQINLLEEAYSPSSPIKTSNFFFGRLPQLDNVIDAINERGQHVAVHGERGVGKTSFAENVATKLTGVYPIKITCNRSDGFRKLWDKAFQRVQFDKRTTGMGFIPSERVETVQLDLFLPDKEDITSLDVQFVLEQVTTNLLFIFDEYDTITDDSVAAEMADTIKSLSDNAPYITIMLVGVGNTVIDVVGAHESIERCLRQVKMPRMSNTELGSILEAGANHLKLEFDSGIAERIVEFSQGFPHFTHLLGKLASRAALEDNQSHIGLPQLQRAIISGVERVDETVRFAYQQATMTSKNSTRFSSVVWACAEALQDEHSTFRAIDIAKAYSKIIKKEVTTNSIAYYIGKLCSSNRGNLLEKVGSGINIKYRFRNPLLKAYIKLRREAINSR